MIREKNMPDSESSEKCQITVTYEIYLRSREEPVRPIATFEVRKDLLQEDPVESFMQIAINHVLATIDIVREHRLILSDLNFNKSIILTDDIQGITIYAPSEENLRQALED